MSFFAAQSLHTMVCNVIHTYEVLLSQVVERNSRKILARLLREGWDQAGISGSHHKFRHTISGKVIVVPHPKKDLPTGTARAIAKFAGWL